MIVCCAPSELIMIHQSWCRRYNIERLPSSRIVKVSEGNVEGSETSALETSCVLVRQSPLTRRRWGSSRRLFTPSKAHDNDSALPLVVTVETLTA